MNTTLRNLIFVDCEAYGDCPAVGHLTEFGAVDFTSRRTYHGKIIASRPSTQNPAIPVPLESPDDDLIQQRERLIYEGFRDWLRDMCSDGGRPIFVSDNPAWDFQWINDGFIRHLGANPFGHSARRIGDFYAGLCGDFSLSSRWKKLRITPHDHNPVHDALGNVEALERILRGER